MSTLIDPYGRPISSRFARAADRSRAKGWPIKGTLRSVNKAIPAHDRKTLAAISRELVFNAGPAKEAIRQKSAWSVGGAFHPQYLGPDTEAGAAVVDWLVREVFPQIDLAGGARDWRRMLRLVSRGIDQGGEDFVLLTERPDRFPAVQLLPCYEFASKLEDEVGTVASGNIDGAGLRDGIFYDTTGGPLQYRRYKGGDMRLAPEDISAAGVVHLFEPEFEEQGRGFPAFAHALDDLRNGQNSKALEAIRQNVISAIYLLDSRGGPDETEAAVTVSAASGEARTVEEIAPGIRYMGGADLSTLAHTVPGEVWESFQDRLWREAIVGAGWSYALVWKSPGQGTAERSEVMRARKAIEDRQETLRYLARRVVNYCAHRGAELGLVPRLQSLQWDFTLPARLTVDDGREDESLREAVEARRMTEGQYQANHGRTAEQHFAELAEEDRLRAQYLGAPAMNDPAEIILPND